MRGNGSRWLRLALLAGGAIGLTSMLTAAAAFGDDTAVIMGGSGIPIPPPVYVDGINDLYLHCDPPACTLGPLATPEGLYPLIGPKELTFDASVAQGVSILNQAIGQQLAEGNHVTVLGYSQSSTIASMEMTNILNGSAGINPDPDQLSFVLLGDPNNPNGGFFERFDFPPGSDPTIPSLGMTFSGATPVTDYPTAIYTAEYDAVSDYPRYPLNVLADLNAVLGFAFVHTQYPSFTPEQLANAVEVPTSPGYDGDTTYYMIPTENLPLLDPLRSIPVVGPVVADLLQPDLRVLVNLGYGDPNYGWVNENADVPTPLGLFPSLGDLEKVPGLLVSGLQEGIQNAISDLQDPSRLFSLEGNPLLDLLQTPYFTAVASEDFSLPATPADGLLGIVNGFSAALSSVYSALLPTADFANALFTTLPAVDADVFSFELAQGDLLDAIGLPIAADVGLLPMLGLFELATVGEGVAFAAIDLLSPFVDLSGLFS
ncbi:PPE family protein PPE28 [Mycobacterium tuberculosis H37Rv] [Mycobacterium shimoidei]|uniref:PPE family protein PPE28 [Mycobacterium tuberculosis H37Rv] n=1 Tax=Mycobacterium shimoidei TaxID=29313 RepID=A0A375Z574_MYCSH|nr:PE-PPE domain-containing protein [Mycobacterium shimoidei]SRX96165.1 PPE family protein PPE28 [Mycobacterium tuberculosis H37Rv] [Mycobacterium shimoidei]